MNFILSNKNYVIGYDADKVEQSIKRSIVSITRTGAELKKIQSSKCILSIVYSFSSRLQ